MSENNKRKRDNNDDHNTPKTVKLRVGGRKHEVSRDLVMDNNKCTMLSSLVSETWLEDPEKEVFIDRNGDTFSYVLDYLRHGEIMLPKTVTMDTFLKELDFYAIDVVPGTIKVESLCLTISKVCEELEIIVAEKREIFNKAQKDLREAEAELQKERNHVTMATKILSYYQANNSIKYHEFILHRSGQRYVFGNDYARIDDYEEYLLNKYLVKFGLEIEGWHDRNCVVKLLGCGILN